MGEKAYIVEKGKNTTQWLMSHINVSKRSMFHHLPICLSVSNNTTNTASPGATMFPPHHLGWFITELFLPCPLPTAHCPLFISASFLLPPSTAFTHHSLLFSLHSPLFLFPLLLLTMLHILPHTHLLSSLITILLFRCKRGAWGVVGGGMQSGRQRVSHCRQEARPVEGKLATVQFACQHQVCSKLQGRHE